MADDTIFISASEVASKLHLKVRFTGARALKIRLWLAARLIGFAGWVSGMNTEVVSD